MRKRTVLTSQQTSDNFGFDFFVKWHLSSVLD